MAQQDNLASTQSPSQGYEAVFDPEVDRKYVCPICLAILREPMQTACGHRFCRICIMGVLSGRPFAKCPVDNAWFRLEDELFEDNAVRREVLSLSVLCDNQREGCAWRGELRDLEAHLTDCPFVLIPCVNQCGITVHQQDVIDHLTVCERRLIHCQHCTLQVAFVDLTKHQLLMCEKFPVSCTLCRQNGIRREDIGRHIDVHTGDCPQTIVPCQFAVFGCQFQDKRQCMPEHYKEAAQHHVLLLLGRITNQERRIEALETSTAALGQRLDDITGAAAIRESTIDEHTEQLSQHANLLRELRSCGYDSLLHWKIPVSGDSPPQQFLSQSFYTGCPGYKVCVCLELVGHREGQDNYASFFVILEKGEFDNQLQFPFNALCHVTLFDQSESSLARQHKTTVIHCTGVPQCTNDDQTLNARRGRLRFLKTEELLSERFVKNGFLYMDVHVNHSQSESNS